MARVRLGLKRGSALAFVAGALVLGAPDAATAGSHADAAGPESARQRALVSMSVNPHARGLRVPRSFLGFSFEFKSVTPFLGNAISGPNTALLAFLRNLTPAGAAPPVIRIGGISAEEVWWNPLKQMPRPDGIHHDLDQPALEPIRDFVERSRSRVIWTLNLIHRDASIARDVMLGVLAGLGRPRILTFELGNEPDLYASRRYGTGLARPEGYGVPNWLREFRRRARILRRAARVPLGGPGSCCHDEFPGALTRLLRTTPGVKLATFHQYFGTNCGGITPASREFATIRRLLGNQRLGEVAIRYFKAVRRARRFRRGVRITETNTVTCAGKPGVSDTFASAVWAPTYLMLLAAVGVKGVNFHTVGTVYSPFVFGWTPETGWLGEAKPLYYGLLMFSRTVANGARILPAPTRQARRRRGAKVDPWVTVDRDGVVRVLVVNRAARPGGRVRIRIRGARGRGTLTRLEAPGLRSKRRVTLGGQAVPAPTADGALAGPLREARVARRRGVYAFSMRGAGAALLSVRTR
jgi:hypothetical protein